MGTELGRTGRGHGTGAPARDPAQPSKRILLALFEPFGVDGDPIVIHCGVGIALLPTDGNDAQALLRSAEAAMWQAKGDSVSRTLGRSLREAVEGDRFECFYQPLFEFRSGDAAGAEALARWNDAKLGSVSPAKLIPLTEVTGLIVAIGDGSAPALTLEPTREFEVA